MIHNIIRWFIVVLVLVTARGTCSLFAQEVPYKYDEKKAITTASGLKYIIIEQGKGKKPKPGDKVSVHYHGVLTDGKKFDSSFDRGTPIEFPLGKGYVIKGWDEGLQLLNEGSKAVFIIPPQLAYGSNERPNIPANSTLIFHVHLVQVKEAPVFKPYTYSEKDVKTTASGLKYVIIEEGKGAPVKQGETVNVHYHGMLPDGKVFDSSFERDQPFPLQVGVGQVIKGWDEGLQLLRRGSKAVLIIPPDLGYGARGIPDVIPENATLIFHIHIQE
ncbi:MAG: FKBP-type peptidyl-prolyl cis-trans isomerase [Bacteroidia bacterium]|nr:FKBP-type peptidyl-prolyl cis-trans isomerase [Bacteroidia bacterium]MDW8157866.1 FKBP-type peptidyl-prolyl cis-trans isomerase [Bacteroidia bacterium]